MATNNSLNNKSGGFTVTTLSTGVVQSNSSGVLSSSEGTAGQLLIGSGSVAPAWANITSNSSTITVTNGSNTINLEVTTPSTSITWNTITTSSGTLVANNGYLVDFNGTCSLALPSTAAVGTLIYIVGIFNKAGEIWKITQAAGQGIGTNGSNTTTGVTGFLEGQYQTSVTLVCTVANTTWQIIAFSPALSALVFN